MATEEKREQRLRLLEDHIGRSLAEAEQSGELRSASGYGKPLDFGDGYDETPAALRMPYKMLKDSGFLPLEVELMREIEALRRSLESSPDEADLQASRQRLGELQQQLTLRLEKLRFNGSL